MLSRYPRVSAVAVAWVKKDACSSVCASDERPWNFAASASMNLESKATSPPRLGDGDAYGGASRGLDPILTNCRLMASNLLDRPCRTFCSKICERASESTCATVWTPPGTMDLTQPKTSALSCSTYFSTSTLCWVTPQYSQVIICEDESPGRGAPQCGHLRDSKLFKNISCGEPSLSAIGPDSRVK